MYTSFKYIVYWNIAIAIEERTIPEFNSLQPFITIYNEWDEISALTVVKSYEYIEGG